MQKVTLTITVDDDAVDDAIDTLSQVVTEGEFDFPVLDATVDWNSERYRPVLREELLARLSDNL